MPYPVKPASNPFFTSPVAAHCAKPEPNAEPSVPVKAPPARPPIPKAPNAVGPRREPKRGASSGKKASGCPVCGFVVIGATCANPRTSAGLTCINIESPYRPCAATFWTCCCKFIVLPPLDNAIFNAPP